MNEFLFLFLSGACGVLLGTVFFGGLWWTVQKGLPSNRAALWFVGSLIFRTSLVLFGFYLISQTNWRNLIASLIGFFAAKVVVISYLRKRRASRCA
jgi:F1F0 ATPase subunit 2